MLRRVRWRDFGAEFEIFDTRRDLTDWVLRGFE
jgi:hypothetical protein